MKSLIRIGNNDELFLVNGGVNNIRLVRSQNVPDGLTCWYIVINLQTKVGPCRVCLPIVVFILMRGFRPDTNVY